MSDSVLRVQPETCPALCARMCRHVLTLWLTCVLTCVLTCALSCFRVQPKTCRASCADMCYDMFLFKKKPAELVLWLLAPSCTHARTTHAGVPCMDAQARTQAVHAHGDRCISRTKVPKLEFLKLETCFETGECDLCGVACVRAFVWARARVPACVLDTGIGMCAGQASERDHRNRRQDMCVDMCDECLTRARAIVRPCVPRARAGPVARLSNRPPHRPARARRHCHAAPHPCAHRSVHRETVAR